MGATARGRRQEDDMNKNVNLGLLVAAFLTFALLGTSDALAQARAGSVTSLTGDVHGMTLNVGDRIITDTNSRGSITLTDNSKLELDESTSMDLLVCIMTKSV